jgi:hypothetical protein
MRNGRDRRSENPFWATAKKGAWFWLGPISGSHQGQHPDGCVLKDLARGVPADVVILSSSLSDSMCIKSPTH